MVKSAALFLVSLVSGLASVHALNMCPGNHDPPWFCMHMIGNYAMEKRDSHGNWLQCYNGPEDCVCKHGYSLNDQTGMCECDDPSHMCASGSCDPRGFCKQMRGPGSFEWFNHQCYDSKFDDCRCPKRWGEDSNWNCICDHRHSTDIHCPGQCDPWAFCEEKVGGQYGPYGGSRPIPNRDCYNNKFDCSCQQGYGWAETSLKCCPFAHIVGGECTGDGSGFGDPHFVTFHGHEFEYHGECDLVLSKVPALEMDIHVRTTIRYDYSFISQAAVRIGEEIFEVASWGEYQLNGMQSVDLPAFISGYPISVKHSEHPKNKFKYTIHMEDELSVEIVTFKDYVAVSVHNATVDLFNDSTGIMGHFVTGDMLGRDGVTVMDEHPSQFAEEWQVQPEVDGQLFSDPRAPQFPHHCLLPRANAISARDRNLAEANVSKEDAMEACAHVDSRKNNCVEDVIKTQDLDIAAIYH